MGARNMTVVMLDVVTLQNCSSNSDCPKCGAVCNNPGAANARCSGGTTCTGTCKNCVSGSCVDATCSANSCQICDNTCGSPRAKTCSDYGQQSTRSGLTCSERTNPGCGLTCYREGTRCSANSCQVCNNACGSPRAKTCADYGYQSNTSGLQNPVTVNPGCSLTCYKEGSGPSCTNECSSSSNCAKCGASCTAGSDGCKDCSGGTTCNTSCQSCSGTSCITNSCGSGYFSGYSHSSSQGVGSTSRRCVGKTCWSDETCENTCTSSSQCSKCGASCRTGSNGCKSCSGGTICSGSTPLCCDGTCKKPACEDDGDCSPGYNCIDDNTCDAQCEPTRCPPASDMCTSNSDCFNDDDHCGGNCSNCNCTGGAQCGRAETCVNGRCTSTTTTTQTQTTTTTTSKSGSLCTNPCNWDRDCTGAGEPKCLNGCCGAADDGPGTQF